MAVALYALFLPFYGPIVDHHFAESEPNHEHIYLRGVSPKHIHPYEVPHTHPKTHPHADSPASDPSSPDLPSDGIVFLASHDAMSQVTAQLTVPPVHVTLDFPDLEGDHSLFAAPGDDVFLQDAFVAPAKKPPRV
jgi:hypothetical protein